MDIKYYNKFNIRGRVVPVVFSLKILALQEFATASFPLTFSK